MATNICPAGDQHNVRFNKRAVLFARTQSRPHDAQRDSMHLSAQLRTCAQLARMFNAEIVRSYVAIGSAAGSGVQELIESLLQTVEQNHIDFVIVVTLDRLARQLTELERLTSRLRDAEARLIT